MLRRSFPDLRMTRQTVRPARVLAGLFLVYSSLYVVLSAITVIYLPARVAELMPAEKVGALAVVSTGASALVMVAHPLIGAFSDRTAGRLGRRAPWMLVGALAACVLVPSLGAVTGLVALAVVWAGTELALNMVQAPASAVVVDRLPENRRGLASGVVGSGFLIGSAIGAAAMGSLIYGSVTALWVIAAAVPLAVVLFIVVNPDIPTVRGELPPGGWRAYAKGFAVNPQRYPDFYWAFGARLLMILAYSSIVTYLLFIMQDYLGLPDEQAAGLAGLVVAVTLASSLPTLLLGGIITDRTGRRKVVVAFASLVMAGAVVIPLLVPTVTAMIVFAVLFGLGNGAYTSVDKALMTLVVTEGSRHAGKDLGILNIATNLPQLAAPLVAWFVVSATGGYEGLFVMSMVFALLGALAILPIRSVR